MDFFSVNLQCIQCKRRPEVIESQKGRFFWGRIAIEGGFGGKKGEKRNLENLHICRVACVDLFVRIHSAYFFSDICRFC